MTETMAPYTDGPRLLADIGGTNARLAIEIRPHQFAAITVLPCNAYPSLKDAMAVFLSSAAVKNVCDVPIRHAAVAIATPVDGDVVRMTNHDWSFSIEAMRAELGLQTLLVVNDFTALAMALPHLSATQKLKIGGGGEQTGHTIGLIGAGTGLGVSGIVPSGQHWIPLHSEGGHVSFSPCNEEEVDILRFCWREYRHVSAERLVSGMGLEIIYRALLDGTNIASTETLAAEEISRRALNGSCPLCIRTIECLGAILGGVAGNVALTLGALGGMYIGGGIVPRLGHLFTNSLFRERFEAKGRFSHYLSQIPTYLITAEYPAFLGVSAILAERLEHSSTSVPGRADSLQQNSYPD
jgi:glucokinase